MLVIGLTGSIATGKSTVSAALAAPPHGIPVIDADVLARKVVEPGTRAYDQIVAYFGPTTPDLLVPPLEDGSGNDISPNQDGSRNDNKNGSGNDKGHPLNRPALGRRVFGDSQERRRDRAVLNSIVHPAVRIAMLKRMLWLYMTGHWAVVLDVPLLFEASMNLWCGAVVVVAIADPDVQASRLLERDAANGLTPQDAKNRIASQTDVRVKAERCADLGPDRGIVLWNDGAKDDLKRSVDQAVERLRASNPPWWSWLLLGCPPLAVVAGTWSVCRNWAASKKWEAQRKDS